MPTARADRFLPALRRVVLVRETADRPDAELLGAFARGRDADAFAELVRRHGPMVLGVCRRLVGDRHAADDAFQAVFLVLARRASAVRPRSAVGNWLYGVAYRTAVKARAVLARRRSRERQVDAMPEPPAERPSDELWSDLRPVIDEELARLPERLRLPVVLCDLEGRPQRQVAKHLGVAQQTLSSRLASARRLLAARLTRRGIALSGGALAGVLGGNASAAAVPPALADGLARAAEAVAVGSGVGELVSAHAVRLSEGVMRMMLLAKLRAAGAAALTAVALTAGLGIGLAPAAAGRTPGAEPGAATRPGPPKPPPPAAPADEAAFFRRVCLDLRGTPPSLVELGYFGADADPNKRRKVIDWLLTDEAVKAHLAKKLGVPPDRVRYVTLGEAIAVALDAGGPAEPPRVAALALSPDGRSAWAEIAYLLAPSDRPAGVSHSLNSDAGLTGGITLNEANFDVEGRPVMPRGNANRTWAELFNPLAASPPAAGYFRVIGRRPGARAELVYPLLVEPVGENLRPLIAWLNGPDPPGERVRLEKWVAPAAPDSDPNAAGDPPLKIEVQLEVTDVGDSDAEFLRRAVQSARGTAPSAVEERYFAEDKDPKKRERLLDLLLKDPAVARKLGDDWKRKMLEPPAAGRRASYENEYRVLIGRLRYEQAWARPTRTESLVGELLGAKKTDEQVLEALSLAVLGRLPTDSERRLTLAAVGKASDRAAAWAEVAKALAATDEARQHAAELNKSNPPPAKPPEKK